MFNCFYKLKIRLESNTDIKIFFQLKDEQEPILKDLNYFNFFTDFELEQLHFEKTSDKLLPVDFHFPILKLYKDYPDNEHYWLIEDDVRFNGDWSVFFDAFKDIKSYFHRSRIRFYTEDKNWFCWNALDYPELKISNTKRIASFNPIYRISNEALRYFYKLLTNRWSRHYEVLIPTLLNQGGYTINEISGQVEFVILGNDNLFYTTKSV